MFSELSEINKRPHPFEHYTAADLWTDEHTSQKMLENHLDESADVSSRNINFIDKSVNWISAHFKLNAASEIIDFGCGPGLYTIRFARNGIKVSGIDFSKRSIEHAKQAAMNEKIEINYYQTDYLGFEPSKNYDLITMIMCDFCALSPGQRRLMLKKFKNSLKPDGRILLDVYSLNAFDTRKEMTSYDFNPSSGFWSPDPYYSFHNTFKYEREKVILDKFTIIEQSRKRIVYNWLQFFSIETLKKEFEENGLKAAEIYSDVTGTEYKENSSEIAIVAKIN